MNGDINFYAAGKFTSRGEWIHGETTAPTTEIIIVTDGMVKLDEAGIRYELTPGSVLTLDPNILHKGYEISAEKTSFYWIHMDISKEIPVYPAKKCFTLREPYHVSILCRQMLHYNSMGAGPDVVNHLLYVLLHELWLQSCSERGDGNALAQSIDEWIRINADRNIMAADVSGKFGYNEDYISRILKTHFGSGLRARINGHRLQLIKKLLLESDLTLSEIADTTGFGDYKLFLKFFKYHAGMTPSEFKHIYYAIHTNNR